MKFDENANATSLKIDKPCRGCGIDFKDMKPRPGEFSVNWVEGSFLCYDCYEKEEVEDEE